MRVRVLLVFALVGLVGRVAAAAVPPPQTTWPEDPTFRVEWKADWQTTLEANTRRWQAELLAARRDRKSNERILALRVLRLKAALLARLPAAEEVRLRAVREVAEGLRRFGYRAAACRWQRHLVEEFPGRLEEAADALGAILRTIGSEPDEVEEGDERVRYAARRLLALARSGAIPAAGPAVALALRTTFELSLSRLDFWRAAWALERARGVCEEQWWAEAQTRLFLSAGRLREAKELYRRLVEDAPEQRRRFRLPRVRPGEATAEPSLPATSTLEAGLDAVRAAGPQADPAHALALLARAARSDGLTAIGPRLFRSLWAAARDAACPLAARAPSSAKARILRAATALSPHSPPEALWKALRTAPWARQVHEALVGFGELELRQGHYGIAVRCFEDAHQLAHSGRVKSAAARGLEVVRGAGVPGHARESAAPPLSQLTTCDLRMPAAPAWVADPWLEQDEELRGLFRQPRPTVLARGDSLVLSGPNVLAVYRHGSANPMWWRTCQPLPPETRERQRRESVTVVPGPFIPVLDGRRLYTRWNLDPGGQAPRGLAAFDLESGEMLWAAGREPLWEGLWPLSDPAVADGRIYALAARSGRAVVRPVFLVCLRAQDGRLLWRRLLGSQGLAMQCAEGSPRLRRGRLALARYGSRVVVSEGAIYCLTNLGFVARCDARDGLLEWARTYDRVRLGPNVLAVLRRRGGVLVTRRAAVFLPRDYQGAFAVEKETGKLLWDRPFVPSERAVGLAGGLALLGDGRRVVALDAETGRLAWEREFPERLTSPPEFAGSSVYAATGHRLYRLAAATGTSIEQREWARGPAKALLPGRRGLALITDMSRVAQEPRERLDGGAGRLLGRPLGLPLRRAWTLRRPGARLLPSPGASTVLLFSGGLLECLETEDRLRVAWRRLVPGGFHTVVHQGHAAVFLYPWRALAVDMRNGARLWERKLDFRVRSWQTCGKWLFLGSPAERLGGGMLEIASGRLLWHREFANSPLLGRRGRTGAVAWDGTNLHLLVTDFKDKRGRLFSLAVRPQDGRIVSAGHLPIGESKRLRRIVVGDGFVFGLRDDVPVICRLRDSSLAEFRTHLSDQDTRIEKVVVSGKYVCLWTKGRQHADPSCTIVLASDAPDRGLRTEGWGTVVGDSLFVTRERTLKRVDLGSGAETHYEIPSSGGRFLGVLARKVTGDKLWVVGAESITSPARTQPVTVHLFDLATGRHIASHPLKGLGGTRNEVAFAHNAILVTDFAGLHAFAAGQERPGGPVVAWRTDGPIKVDGLLGDWKGMGGLRFGHAEVRAAHDDQNLYLAVSTTDHDLVPRVGPRPSGTGDSLEVGLLTNLGAWHFELGVAPTGTLTCGRLWDAQLPPGLIAALRPDPQANRLHYELAIPLAGVVRREWRGWDKIGVSVNVWDDSHRAAGVPETASLGPCIPGGPLRRDASEVLLLHRLSHGERQAAMAIVDELPDLPASFEFVRNELLATATSPESFIRECWRFIERHPRSRSAEAALSLLDSFLRRIGIDDPTEVVIARAKRAGVPADVLERYRRSASAYLSQWVFLPKGPQFRALVVEADDGLRSLDSWGHRAYWGSLPLRWRVPPTLLGPREAVPIGSWRELRIPLIAIGLHDKPICALGFVQQGGGQIAWDTTAVSVGGKRHVILDDPPPPGKLVGDWEWTADHAHTGRKAHCNPPPARSDEIRSHHIELSRPVIEHLLPWPAGPSLSQWVYLDPRKPPRMLSLDLHDGRKWSFCAVWGEKLRNGFYLGPLPPAGRWVELRVPLAITPLASRPIAGVAFGQFGGRAFWDRTAVVARGKEVVLLDDAASPLHSAARQPLGWLRPKEGCYAGLARPTLGIRGVGLRCDGRTVHREVPHSDPLEPQNLTVETWVKLDTLIWTGDTRRWVVNKNRNEATSGHYGLVVARDTAGAYLNIGGGEGGQYSAWSPPGAIAAGQWHHLAMTYDGADLSLYVDGKLIGRTAVNKPRLPGTTSLHIGERQDGYCHLNGAIDEVWLYNRALSAQEIAQRRAAAGAPPESRQVAEAVVGHWGFDADATLAAAPRAWHGENRPLTRGTRAVALGPLGGFAACALAAPDHPVFAHLPFEAERAREVLQAQLPRLGRSEAAWEFLLALLDLAPGAQARAQYLERFLENARDHPREAEALAMMRQALTEADEASAETRLGEFIRRRGFSPRTLYDFHRRYLGTPKECVHEWQVLGPFPNPEYPRFGPKLPPDGAPVRLDATFTGAKGPITWKPHLSPGDYVDLDSLLKPNEYVLAYAASWVRSQRARRVLLAVGSDDDCIVWLNGRKVLRGDNVSYARPGAFMAPAELKAGWNEFLVKITEEYETWGFYFELLDPETFRRPDGLRISPEPPR